MIEFTPCSECQTAERCIDSFQSAAGETAALILRSPLRIRPIEVDLVIEELCRLQLEDGCGYYANDIDDIVQGIAGKPVAYIENT